ncbi:MAG: insulinase family protein, partial [Desulfobacterales bacterium]|nr:insulinase family protein [Desulfobacterales bacterium]
YVYERCKQLMCADEPYGIYKCGDVKTLDRIENDELYKYYQKLLDTNPIHLFVVGDLDSELIIEKVRGVFQNFPSRSTNFAPIIATKTEIVPKQVIEEEKIRQGKLSIGFRTNLTRSSDLYPAMVVFNGIFGSLPHSKLFKNVREEAGLAYYIYSSLDSTKGIIQVDCGIESSDFEKVLKIVDKQLQNIIDGEINEEELEFTIKSYSRQFRYLTDENSTLIDSCMVEVNNGLEPIITEFTEQLRNVTIKDVRSVAEKLELDTVYFLKSKEGA